mmetsp:Transcript_4338/g.12524  ORF Transcript_4338/g.12524 Transcript_4338/m.12524 type:complete len:390 (-) Transcript_4338:178-1347(-)
MLLLRVHRLTSAHAQTLQVRHLGLDWSRDQVGDSALELVCGVVLEVLLFVMRAGKVGRRWGKTRRGNRPGPRALVGVLVRRERKAPTAMSEAGGGLVDVVDQIFAQVVLDILLTVLLLLLFRGHHVAGRKRSESREALTARVTDRTRFVSECGRLKERRLRAWQLNGRHRSRLARPRVVRGEASILEGRLGAVGVASGRAGGGDRGGRVIAHVVVLAACQAGRRGARLEVRQRHLGVAAAHSRAGNWRNGHVRGSGGRATVGRELVGGHALAKAAAGVRLDVAVPAVGEVAARLRRLRRLELRRLAALDVHALHVVLVVHRGNDLLAAGAGARSLALRDWLSEAQRARRALRRDVARGVLPKLGGAELRRTHRDASGWGGNDNHAGGVG